MILIDGSQGEGGGQVLRTSLALSMVTGRPFRIEKIRAGRKKPGLMRQHLTAVRAAAQVCNAKIGGDAIGSVELTFEPATVQPGNYQFAVGTAGSATLVLQTVLPALLLADQPSELTLEGGTHNPWAPPFDFLTRALLPLLDRMGLHAMATLDRPGFYPAGGGKFRVSVQPRGELVPLDLLERGQAVSRLARAVVARLPERIAERELALVRHKLNWSDDCLRAETANDSVGPGNVILIEIASEHVTELFTGFGSVERSSEEVAGEAIDEARRYLAAGVPVGVHLADQLLIPLALAGGRFRTLAPSRHTTTNIDVIKHFCQVNIACEKVDRDAWEVRAEKET